MKEKIIPEDVAQWVVARGAHITGDTEEWDVHYNTKGYYVTVSSTVEPEVVTVIADGGVRGEFYAFRIKKEELRNELERLEKLL